MWKTFQAESSQSLLSLCLISVTHAFIDEPTVLTGHGKQIFLYLFLRIKLSIFLLMLILLTSASNTFSFSRIMFYGHQYFIRCICHIKGYSFELKGLEYTVKVFFSIVNTYFNYTCP